MGATKDFSVMLVALAPFLAAFTAPLVTFFARHRAGWVLAIVPAAIFAFLTGFLEPIAHGETARFVVEWIPAYDINLSFYIDGLSLTFAMLISGIGTFIVIYSGGYLKGDPMQGRFFMFLLMFMGSMLGLVTSDNLITLFIFWELTSITSFLLIGYDHKRQAARRAALQALVVTGGGGLALMAGLILLGFHSHTWELSEILRNNPIESSEAVYLPIFVLVLAGAFTKSAQFPFHFWLPNAMEAPTPVSAYLHSATMVKAGIYLLARMHPVLGASLWWQIVLPIFGATTLIIGALIALRKTDMKQMLAYTTMASLGLLVMLIGVGTEAAMLAMVVFLVGHSFYKGALFMIVGAIDHESGTRELLKVSGLRRAMPITFIAAIFAAISMAGIPGALGYIGKEEIYAALTEGLSEGVTGLPVFAIILFVGVIIAAVFGNALMLVVGASIAIRPFFGKLANTPKHAHEAPISLWLGPVILGILGVAAGTYFVHEFGEFFGSPAASAAYDIYYSDIRHLTEISALHPGIHIENHMHFAIDPSKLIFWLSLLTWSLGALFFWKLGAIRNFMAKLLDTIGWGPDKGFDQFMHGLLRTASFVTRLVHHGQMERYFIVVFLAFAAAVIAPMALLNAWPKIPAMPELSFYEYGVLGIAALGVIIVVLAQTRLFAIISLGIQGFAVALIFALLGAPDLAFTQFMVETLTVVILALIMTRLSLSQPDHRVPFEIARDGIIALACGIGVSLFLLRVLEGTLDTSLSDFFIATSRTIAHGRNVVNVILVDFRGLDTLGEISVVLTAGVAIIALIRVRASGRKSSRRPTAKASAKISAKGEQA